MFTRSRNSQFQYMFFIAGSCYTADEAYRVLVDQRNERAHAVKLFEIGRLRRKAALMRFKLAAENPTATDAEKLETEASLLEMEEQVRVAEAAYEEAVRERDFLDKLITIIKPHRKYADLPDHEAMQACQREEWRLRLMARAENYLVTTGTIPANELATMRAHPDFHSAILPHVQKVVSLLEASQDPIERQKALCAPPPLLKRIDGLEDEFNKHPLLLAAWQKPDANDDGSA